MSFSYEVYKKVYPDKDVQFDISSYFPLIVRHCTFASIDDGNMLEEKLSLYCNYCVIEENDISAAKNRIRQKLHPLIGMMINYSVVLYYSGENDCNIDRELAYLNSIKREVYFSGDYLINFIVVIDSGVAEEDERLIKFLKNIQEINDAFDICVFTYEKEIKESFEVLVNSIAGSIIYRSHALTKDEYLVTRKSALEDIGVYTRNLELGGVPKIKWRSMYASFNNKQHDIIAHILKEICNMKVTGEALSSEVVVKEASNIGINFSDIPELKSMILNAFNYIPAVVNNFKIPKDYNFRGICDEKFGVGGYTLVEISCKTTLSGFRKAFSTDYKDGANQLLFKLAEYYHDDLIGTAVEGIEKYLGILERECVEAKRQYDSFSRKPFSEDEEQFEYVLEDYADYFLKYEEAKKRQDYWELIKTELRKDYMLAAELTEIVNEFRSIQNQLALHGGNYNIDNIPIGALASISLKEFLKISENSDLINMLKESCEKYADNAHEIILNADIEYIFAYNVMPGLSEKYDISANYGDYQLNGKQLFCEYWAFA